MKPYYEHRGVSILHGDCAEIIPHLNHFDLLLTDPPYGIEYNPKRSRKGTEPGRNRANWKTKTWQKMKGDDHEFSPNHILGFPNQRPAILWGANHYAHRLLPSRGWLVWDKMKADGFGGGKVELAWTNIAGSTMIFRHLWDGFRRDSEGGQYLHPTQKPVALMDWCINILPPCGTIVDPYMGSGSVLIAAARRGREAIGIESEEAYCETAARRLNQESILNFG